MCMEQSRKNRLDQKGNRVEMGAKILWGPGGHCEDSGFYQECDRKFLGDLIGKLT